MGKTDIEAMRNKEKGSNKVSRVPEMYTIPHNHARLYNCDETCFAIAQHKHMNILGLKVKRQISSILTPKRGSLWQSSTVLVQMDASFLRYLYFQENIWTKIRWIAPRLDQSTRAIPRGGYRARFSPSSFFISSNIKPTK